MVLSQEQEYVINKFKNGENIFISGPGGTGKTFLIKELLKVCKKSVQVCAMTGCAAILLDCGARTIHSWSGIKIANGEIHEIIDRLYNNKFVRRAWRTTHVLILDEVSMMSKKIFDLLNTLAKTMRNNSKPFGNMQVIFVGDFYQLPPVERSKQITEFCFESDEWKEVFNLNNHIILSKIFRQDDEVYKDILMKIRKGEIDEKMEDILKTRIVDIKNGEEDYDNIIKIFPLKASVDRVNLTKFLKIEKYEYKCDKIISKDLKDYMGKEIDSKKMDAYKRASEKQIEFEVDYLYKNNPSIDELSIKEGSRVMCIVNLDMEKGIYNGSQGTIKEIIVLNDKVIQIIVLFDNGEEKGIDRYIWQSELFPCLGVSQFPLVLAWAITIHKIQGATLDKAIVDCGNNVFECGQTYVALSRIRRLSGLYLTGLNMEKIKVNQKVVEFYNEIEKEIKEIKTESIFDNFKYEDKDKDVKIIKI